MTNFSVLLSVYKKENSSYLDAALASILVKQSLLPNEVIIVKDGPLNEKLNKVLEKYLNLFSSTIKIVGYETNKGLGFALNFGLNKCTNEIIFRMDTDDICYPNRFEIQMIEFRKNPNLTLLGGYMTEFIKEETNIISQKKVPLDVLLIKKRMRFSNPFNHPTIMYNKTDILSLGGYNADFHGFEDYELWARVINANLKVKNMPFNLVNFRVNDSQINRRKGGGYIKREIKLIKRLFDLGLITRITLCLKVILSFFIRVLPSPLFKKLTLLYRKF